MTAIERIDHAKSRSSLAGSLLETLGYKGPERELPEFSQSVVRVVTTQVAPPDHIRRTLIPTEDEIRQAQFLQSETTITGQQTAELLFDHILAPGNLMFTHTIWEVKNTNAVNPGQVMLPGGKIKDESRQHAESVAAAAVRELNEKLHIFGVMKDNISPQGRGRWYKTIHPHPPQHPDGPAILEIHEKLASTEIPPFLRSISANPKDKIGKVLHLTPQQVIGLLDREQHIAEGIVYPLLDSLAQHLEDPEFPVTASYEQAYASGTESLPEDQGYYPIQRTKNRIEELVRLYEKNIRGDIIRELINSSDHHMLRPGGSGRQEGTMRKTAERFYNGFLQPDVSLENLAKIEFEFEKFLLSLETNYQRGGEPIDLEQIYGIETLTALQDAGIPEIRLIQRAKLIRDLERAAKRVIFQKNMRAIENSGPQKPFLVAQLLLEHDTTGAFEILGAEREREVGNVYRMLRRMFGYSSTDMFENKNWYKEFQAKIRHARELKRSATQSTNQVALDEYLGFVNEFNWEFADEFDIPVFRMNTAIAKAKEFRAYLDEPLSRITDRKVRDRLMRIADESTMPTLYDLVFTAVDESEPKDRRWAAWMTLITALYYDTAKQIYDNNLKRPYDLDPLGDVFTTIAGNRIKDAGNQDSADMNLDRFEPTSARVDSITVIIQGDPITFDISDIKQYIFSAERAVPKDEFSLTRKLIERGDELHEVKAKLSAGKKIEIEDFFGRLIVLDSSDFMDQFLHKYTYYIEHDDEFGVAVDVLHEWQKQFTASILRAYEEVLEIWQYNQDPSQQYRSRIRQTGVLNGLLEFDNHRGSGASNVTFDWLKFVQRATKKIRDHEETYREEIQIYADRDDLKTKKADDTHKFGIDRLFVAHQEGYWPIIFALYSLQDTYPEVIRSRYRQEIPFENKKNGDSGVLY